MEEPGEAGQRAERAPLAREEGMEVSPTLAENEVIGGNESHGAINLGWISRVLEDPMPQGQAAF